MVKLRRWVDRTLRSASAFRWSQRCSDPFRVVPLRGLVARIPHDSVLDLGCGIGDLCSMNRGRSTGVDRPRRYIRYAHPRFRSASRWFVVGDARARDPGLGHHDLVALVSVLHHLGDRQVHRCLTGLRAVTPRLLLLVDIALARSNWMVRRIIRPLDRGRHWRSSARWWAMVEGAGWRVRRLEVYAGLTGLFRYIALLGEPPAAWTRGPAG